MTLLLKDPAAALDYAVDWGKQYLGGDAIAQSEWSVEPEHDGGIAVQASHFDPTEATVSVAGGVPGHVYRLSNRIVLESGLIDRRSIIVRVEAR